ncbi:hypothetical protein E2C01_024845 [Portunus trituberculatus]|uniref:Uncharacterized protein n=1 Tax=Portunus trituberculatus TaxID=210409 RepID=A0A5B7EBT7_PORTR|nr:hypothetical protein [Portunus trituberculatus]
MAGSEVLVMAVVVLWWCCGAVVGVSACLCCDDSQESFLFLRQSVLECSPHWNREKSHWLSLSLKSMVKGQPLERSRWNLLESERQATVVVVVVTVAAVAVVVVVVVVSSSGGGGGGGGDGGGYSRTIRASRWDKSGTPFLDRDLRGPLAAGTVD